MTFSTITTRIGAFFGGLVNAAAQGTSRIEKELGARR